MKCLIALLTMAVLVGCSPDPGLPGPEAAPTSPDSSPTEATSQTPGEPAEAPAAKRPDAVHSGYFFRSVEPGRGPQVPLVTFRTVTGPDGDHTRLPPLLRDQHYLSVVRSGDGLLVCRTAAEQEMDGSGYSVTIHLDADGVETGRWLGVPLEVDLDSGVALWRDGALGVRVATLATGAERLVPIEVGAPRALVGEDVVVAAPRGRLSAVGPQGQLFDLPPGVAQLGRPNGLHAVSEATGLVFGQRRRSESGEHDAALDLDTGEVVWTSDRWRVRTVSSDGRYVAATSSATGGDADAIGILDARTGETLAELPLLEDRLFEVGSAFERDGSLLVQVGRYDQRRERLTWAVLRLRRDGRVRRTSRVFATEDYAVPFALGVDVRS